MKGLLLIAFLLAFVPFQAAADWKCPRGSKLVQAIYAGGMAMAVSGPTCVEKRSIKSKNIPVPPSCEAGSFAYYSNETWSCESQSAGAPSTLAPSAMTACGMPGQPPCGTGQSGSTAPSPSGGGTSNYGSGGGSLNDSLSSPPLYSNSPTTPQPAPSPACPSGATLTSSIKLHEFSATNVNPPVCIVSFDPGRVYPQPPVCQSPRVALYAMLGFLLWGWSCTVP